MEYRLLGGSGFKVPALCLGTATFGGGNEFFRAWGNSDVTEAKRLIDIALDAGCSMVDSADAYSAGLAEEILGQAIAGRRNRIIISTKATFRTGEGPNDVGSSRHHLIAACEASLKRLGTDYIDLWQMHGFDAMTPIEETMRALDDLVHQGKVRYLGASNFTAWQMMKALWTSDKGGLARFDSLQPQYSLICRDIERELLPMCRSEGVGVIPWSPLGGGFLSGKYKSGEKPPEDGRLTKQDIWHRLTNERNYRTLEAVEQVAKERGRSVSQIALAWCNQQRGISSVIYGARTQAQNDDNLGAVGLKLDAPELEALDKASALPIDREYPFAMQARYPGPRP